MPSAFRAVLIAIVAAQNAGALADEIAAKLPADAPLVQVHVTLAEFDEKDRAEIDRACKDGSHQDEEMIRALEKRKLLRVVASPTIEMPSGVTATISHKCGRGLDLRGRIEPTTLDIEISTRVELRPEQWVVISNRCRETTGKGKSQRKREFVIGAGGSLQPGKSSECLFWDLGDDPESVPEIGGGKLLLVETALVEPKSARDFPPAPRFQSQAAKTKR